MKISQSLGRVALLILVWVPPAFLSAQAPRQQDVRRAASLPIVPLTQVGPDGQGYMADPQPVRLAARTPDHGLFITGTTRAVAHGAFPIERSSFTWTPLQVNAGLLQGAIRAAGAHITNIQNIDVFQDDAQGWHAAVTIGLSSPAHPKHWTVVAHASPVGAVSAERCPLSWSADTLLTGSLTEGVNGNYDGKYFEDKGHLYLLYVKGTAPAPDLRNAIVLQPMLTPQKSALEEPVTLLTPDDRYGALNSEWYANTKAKLVEAPYLTRFGTKYALVYSTGAYLTSGYKTGVAWSDTLVPRGQQHYRKVLMPDAKGIWQDPDRTDVRYLLQSEKPMWPNFSAAQVVGPGVAAAVQGPGGALWLIFNGFAPDDMPRNEKGQVDGTHRRPFAMRLQSHILEGNSVQDVSDKELSHWLEPELSASPTER